MLLFDTYKGALDPSSDQNRFRACVYNKIDPSKTPSEQLKFMRENIPLAINGKPVDLAKWTQAVENKPAQNELLPTQVASTAELKERTLNVLKSIKEVALRTNHVKQTLGIV